MRWIVLAVALGVVASGGGLPDRALAEEAPVDEAQPQDWVPLSTDAEITEALAGQTLVYDAYTRQSFSPSGATLYVTERAAQGRWAARNGQYCSVWPPSAVWTCYDLQINGTALRFVSEDQSATEGRYAE